MSAEHITPLQWALTQLARQHGIPLDAVRLQAALKPLEKETTVLQKHDIDRLAKQLGWKKTKSMGRPDRAHLPLLVRSEKYGWGLLTDGLQGQQWTLRTGQGPASLDDVNDLKNIFRLVPPERRNASGEAGFQARLRSSLREFSGTIGEAITASFIINVLTAVVSFFSLQVYDKVIPSRSIDTLTVMFIGVMILIGFEWLMKWARSRVMDAAVVGIDSRLSREVFERLLSVRLDQMPASVGSLASQLRGYEQVRSFYTASTLFALVDVPAAVIFVVIIAMVASPYLAFVPFSMAVVALVVGVLFRRRIKELAQTGVREANMKTGLLVETVEGAETIKAAQGGWRFLSKWIDLSSAAIGNDLKMRHTNEGLQYFLASIQQISYVCLVSLGAMLVVKGEITMGALIASSILGGRVLAAVMMLPNLMVQHAHASAASDGIDSLFKLQTDHDPQVRPLIPSNLQGNYNIDNVMFTYHRDAPAAIQVKQLQFKEGERVGILGPIGSGKSTLLKMLAGLYRPTEGRVLIDGLDISHIAREALSRQVGYLQQDHRLFQGTLRENLLVGLPDPGDDVLKATMSQTGLLQLVSEHPMGLDLPIFEGGKGLSGGQKQLLAFTRMVLARPNVMLLDEPTASMDDGLEARCLQVLQSPELARSTLLLVTHKMSLLPLVQRLVVVAQGRVVLDGPRDAVLAQLRNNTARSSQQIGGNTAADTAPKAALESQA
jgi:ATP-binding cassette subfamily C protein LapB